MSKLNNLESSISKDSNLIKFNCPYLLYMDIIRSYKGIQLRILLDMSFATHVIWYSKNTRGHKQSNRILKIISNIIVDTTVSRMFNISTLVLNKTI